MAFITVSDASGRWMQRAFLSQAKLTVNGGVSNRRRQYRDTLVKFTDTSFGGSFEINPLPQYTRYADIRPRASMAGVTDLGISEGSAGLGSYYSRAFDDNAQRIYLRMGTPEFNSLTSFYSGFYNREAAMLARRGRSTGIAEALGRFVGTIISIPFLPFTLAGEAYRWAAQIPTTRYYYSKPAMPLYWRAVENIVNNIAVNMRLIPAYFHDSLDKTLGGSGDATTANTSLETMQKAYPKLFFANGGVNIYAIAGKATRISVIQQKKLRSLADDSANANDLDSRVDNYLSELEKTTLDNTTRSVDGVERSLDNVFKEYLGSSVGVTTGEEKDADEETSKRGFFSYDDNGTVTGFIAGEWDKVVDQAIAEKADGTDFLCLRVNHTGSISESFSNQVGEAEITNKLNGFSSSVKNSRFSFAGGNVGDGPVANILESIFGAATDFAQGLVDQTGIGGLIGLAGSAFVDIPKVWENSSSNMASMNYTMELRATSGTPLSIFKDIYMPMACVLAAALPLSTGQHSYNSPFLVELWDKGRAKTRLGLITELSIVRGVGNQGWSVDGLPLGVDLSFTVTELSSVLHMPLKTSEGIFSEASLWSDWMATLGSLSLYDQEYISQRFNYARTRLATQFYQWTNPSRAVTNIFGSAPGRLVKLFTTAVERP